MFRKGDLSMNDENYNKIYRFCDGEIVDGLNQTHYNPQKEDDMQCICTILNAQINQANELQKRNNRQKETIEKQQEIIDNYIDIKAKLNAKIKEYETKSEEYELSACGCGSKHNRIKKTALEEFRDEIYIDKNTVNDVLKSWSQKNLTAKQLQVVLAIMEELNVIGDVE